MSLKIGKTKQISCDRVKLAHLNSLLLYYFATVAIGQHRLTRATSDGTAPNLFTCNDASAQPKSSAEAKSSNTSMRARTKAAHKGKCFEVI